MELLPLVIFFFTAFGITLSIFGLASFFSNTRQKRLVRIPLGRMRLNTFHLIPMLIVLIAFTLLFFSWMFTLSEVLENSSLYKSFIIFFICFICSYVIFLLAKMSKGDRNN